MCRGFESLLRYHFKAGRVGYVVDWVFAFSNCTAAPVRELPFLLQPF